MTLSFKKLVLTSIENQQRMKTYLCLKNTMDRFTKLQKVMKTTNTSILALNAAMAIKPNPITLKIKKMIQLFQNKKALLSLASAFKNNSCRGLQYSFIKRAFPLQKKLVKIRRSVLGTALFKRKSTSFILPSRSRPPMIFIIKGKIEYRPQLTITQTKEVPLSFFHYL